MKSENKVRLESYASKMSGKKGKQIKKKKKVPYKADCFDPNEYKSASYRTKYR